MGEVDTIRSEPLVGRVTVVCHFTRQPRSAAALGATMYCSVTLATSAATRSSAAARLAAVFAAVLLAAGSLSSAMATALTTAMATALTTALATALAARVPTVAIVVAVRRKEAVIARVKIMALELRGPSG